MKNILLTLMVFGIVGCATSHTTKGDAWYGYSETFWTSPGDNGQYYKGYKKEALFHGPGERLEISGEFKKGWFENNKFIGPLKDFNEFGIEDGLGRLDWSDGSYYSGHWKNKKFNGEGFYKDAKGNYYLGTFKDGKMHGKGKYYKKNDKFYLSGSRGSFNENIMTGEFIIHPANDSDYAKGVRGYFKNGRFEPSEDIFKKMFFASMDLIVEGTIDGLVNAAVSAAIYEPCTPQTKVKIKNSSTQFGDMGSKTTRVYVTQKNCDKRKLKL